jgi:alkylmercury lyase-like protein
LTQDEIRLALSASPPVESTRADAAQWVVATARHLAETGRPIPQATSEVTVWLDRYGQIQRDDDGNVIGVAGLTLLSTGIRLDIGSRRLHTWCAIDALFFPRVLNADEFSIRARCASTGRAVRVSGRDGTIDACSPSYLMVSVPVPEAETISPAAACDRYGPGGSLCSGSHFLIKSDGITDPVVTLETAWSLAQTVWAEPLLRAAGLRSW